MKTAKLLDKLGGLMNTSKDVDKERLKKLCKVIKELKQKQKKFEKQLKDEDDKERRKSLKRSIEVIRVQRQKGAEAYQAMKKARAEAKAGKPAAD
jgi:hypothetical protein